MGWQRRAARLHRHLHERSCMAIPRWPSARLTLCPKLNPGQRALRFPILRETPMPVTVRIAFQTAKMLRVVEAVGLDFLVKIAPFDADGLGGLGNVPVEFLQLFRYEGLLKISLRLLEGIGQQA
jgi:hypothetical protein